MTPVCLLLAAVLAVYPVPPAYHSRLTPAIQVSVNGASVPVLKPVAGPGGIAYAHFSASGTITVAVSVNEPLRAPRISPPAQVSAVTIGTNRLTFSMSAPGYAIVQLDSHAVLAVIADPPETNAPALSAPGVFDVTKEDVDPTGQRVCTAGIQRAIDRLSTGGGGILYFPPGAYRSGTIQVKSGVSLYLAGGAVLIGSTQAADFPVTGTQLRRGRKRHSATFVSLREAHDVRIFGRGTIDANGEKLNFHGFYTGLNVVGCERVTVDGVILTGCRGWTAFAFSKDLVIDRFKSLQDLLHASNDACDICNCEHVRVKNCLLMAGDDTFCVKTCSTAGGMASTWGYQQTGKTPARNIILSDSVLYANAAAIKIGMQVLADITDVTFDNIDIVRTRGLAINHDLGTALVERVQFRDIRVEDVSSAMHYSARNRPLDFEIKPVSNEPAPSGGVVRDVLLHNVSFANFGEASSRIAGDAGGWSFTGIRCENLKIAGRLVTDIQSGRMETNFVNSLTFEESPTN